MTDPYVIKDPRYQTVADPLADAIKRAEAEAMDHNYSTQTWAHKPRPPAKSYALIWVLIAVLATTVGIAWFAAGMAI